MIELGRDELAVVGELAVDHAGGQADSRDPDGRLLLSQHQLDLGVLCLSSQARGLGHGAGRQDRFAYVCGRALERDGAHRQAIAVSGGHGEPVGTHPYKHAGENGPGFVARCRAHDAFGTRDEAVGGNREAHPGTNREFWVLAGLVAVEAERRAPARDLHLPLVLVMHHGDRAGRHAAHEVSHEPRKHHRSMLLDAGILERHPQRHLHVGGREFDHALFGPQQHVGENRDGSLAGCRP